MLQNRIFMYVCVTWLTTMLHLNYIYTRHKTGGHLAKECNLSCDEHTTVFTHLGEISQHSLHTVVTELLVK